MKSFKLKSFVCLLLYFLFSGCIYADTSPLFPTGIISDETGNLYMTEKCNKRVAVYSPNGEKLIRTYKLLDTPTGVTIYDNKLFVTTSETIGSLHILRIDNGSEITTIETGSGACCPTVNPNGKKIYVCNQFKNNVTEIDVENPNITREVSVLREPKACTISHDGKYLYVTNFLPAQRADVDYVAASVSVIDLDSFSKIKDIKLANGSNAVRGICLSSNGKYVYVSHNLGRYNVPTSQLQQGWMNTSAFSIINTEKQERVGTIVVDEPERGAAGVWGIMCGNDKIFISHSGTHEISVINEKEMLKKFDLYDNKQMLEYDLTFLHGIRERIALKGNGPRNMCIVNNKLVIPTYFADILNVLDIENNSLTFTELNPGRTENSINRGEKYFNDASHCFQNWQSCNGCHPGEGRTDGMNWDLLNDGIGNSKNCKSLIFSHFTAPSMITGIRETAEWAVRAGFRFIQFFDVSEQDAKDVDAYLKSLKPISSPYLINGELSTKAKVGKKLFDKFGCSSCHSGEYYTDRQMHRIGKDIEFEKGWDTPTLREVWRTAPYLFDGRAATIQDVLKIHKHGLEDKKITNQEIESLAEYINSL